MNAIKQYFGIDGHNTTIKREVLAGLTTFLTMAYIIFVNPDLLAKAGMDKGAVFVATCLASALGCFLMGLIARLPVALAPGMGLNAFFTFTVVLGMGKSWQVALGAVFISGLLFVLISAFKLREWLINAIPYTLKQGIVAGIGAFLAFIALKSSGIIVASPATYVTMGKLTDFAPAMAILSFFLIVVFVQRKVPAAVMLSILIVTVISLLAGQTHYNGIVSMPPSIAPTFMQLDIAGALDVSMVSVIFAFLFVVFVQRKVPAAVMLSILIVTVISLLAGQTHYNGIVSMPPSIAPTFMQLDIAGALDVSMVSVIFAFLFVVLFDTSGTLIGVTKKAGLMNDDGKIPNLGKALFADSTAAVAGSLLGTSSVTSYVESTAGVAAGGRTGLTAIVVGALFLLALFFAPLAGMIPAYATAGAIFYVAVLMLFTLREIDWDDLTEASPVAVVLLLTPLTFSIADGIALGFITYTIAKLVSGRHKEISIAVWVLTIILLAKLIFLS